jgi:hypothetical protein
MSVLSGEFRIRDDLSVEFSFDPALRSIEAHWTPRPPSKLSADELATYRRRRNEFLQQLAKELGGSVLVVEA